MDHPAALLTPARNGCPDGRLGPVSIGHVPWTREDMLADLDEFCALYEARPIPNNMGGMRAPHMFMTWFALRQLQPRVIIESGVWLGQGTWLFEQACPDAQIHCIDPILDRVRYRSPRAVYHREDLNAIDWAGVPREDTLLFFDDHQNAYERLRSMRWLGFRHAMFEDNYPPGAGDCYSLKQVFMGAGFTWPHTRAKKLRFNLRQGVNSVIGRPLLYRPAVEENRVDALNLYDNLEVYYEFPPVIRSATTKWGTPWTDERYPTPRALLDRVETPEHAVFERDARNYNWMCYVRLKGA